MIKSLILILALTGVSVAVEYKKMTSTAEQTVPAVINFPYAKDYILNGHGNWNETIENIVKNDKLFAEANDLLNNSNRYINKNIPEGFDPEVKNKVATKLRLPDIPNALKKLVESAEKHQNPVSAYEAVLISIKVYGKGANNPIYSDLQSLSKIMYLNDVCDGYVLYGEQLEKGQNISMAYDVYTKGSKNKQCTGWYQAIINGRLSAISVKK